MKLKFAVLGCGMIGSKHIRLIKNNRNINLVAIIDINKEKLDKINIKKIYKFISLEKFFQSNLKVDVIIIATPNGFHAKHGIKCLKNNLNIVVEKPLALTSIDAKKINNKAEKLNKKVFVVMQNRYSPPSRWIKKVVEKNILGKIHFVQLSCFWNRDKKYYKNHNWHGKKDVDGGTLYTQFSHFIDLIYWLFGDIKNISSKFYNLNHKKLIEFEDSGIVSFEFKKGGKGVISYSTSVWKENLESSMTIIAENGTVKIGGQYMEKVEYCNIRNYKIPNLKNSNPPNDYGSYKGSAENHIFVIQNVIDVLKNNKKITTNAYDGYKVTKIIESIYNS